MAYLIKKQSKRLMLLLFTAFLVAVPTGCATKASPQPEASYQDTETAPDSALITDIRVLEKDQGTIVELTGNRALTFTSVKQADPTGVLLYFPNTLLETDTGQLPVAGIVTGIESSELATDTATVRVAITLAQDSTYTVDRDENRLEVIFPAADTAETDPMDTESAGGSETAAPMQAASQPAGIQAPMATEVSSISTADEDAYTEIRVLADGTITDYSSFTLTNPPRIVYDLKNIQSPYTSEKTVAVNDSQVDRVRYYSHPDKVRLVIDTASDDMAYSATSQQNGLTIQVGNKTRAAAKAPVYLAKAAQASDAPSTPASTGTIGLVNQIDFKSEKDGKSTILIGATEAPEYTLEKTGDTTLKLTLFRTKLPDYRERPFITTGFESAVDRVLPYTRTNAPDQTFFTFELRESVPYYVEEQGNLLMVHFEASSVPAKAPAAELTLADQRMILDQTPALETVAPAKPEAKAVTAKTTTEPEEIQPSETTHEYTGEKITLDFYDTDIKNVFRILREVSGMNFAIDKDVNGTVTLSFDEPVPWDQVLDLILKMNQLGKTMEGSIVRIATLDTIQKEENSRQAALLAAQKSKEQELALEPIRTEYIPVNYSNAKSEVLPHIKTILTEGRGNADVDERSNLIVITDTDRVIKQAKSIVQQLDKVTPQVMIEARVVEVNTTFSQGFGISWELSQEGVVKNFLGGSYDWDMAMDYPASDSSGSVGFQFSRVAGTPLILDAALNAMETQSQGKIISSPKVLTLDNKTASIKQGYEVGYTERDDSGGSSIAFKSVDLLLEVTPHVTPDNRVSMTVYITKNDIGDTYNDMPTLTTNEATTEFLVEDGETIAIGGIIKKTETTEHSGFPILKDLPGLSWLFGSESEATVNKELLIFITPKIVTLTQKSVE